MNERAEDSSTPDARFLASDRTSTMADYPKACPKCQAKLPLTRGVFPLRFSPRASLMLICGVALALVSSCTLIPFVLFLLDGGDLWIPGVSMIKRAVNMQREYEVACRHCGFSFRVKGPSYD